MKRAGEMWVRDEDRFMPSYFEATGDRFQIEHLDMALSFCHRWSLALDIGAHYGSWSRHLARRFKKVLAFEPIGATYACLEKNTAGFSNIQLFANAVGPSSGKIRIGIGKMYHHPGMETVIAGVPGDIDQVAIDDLNLPRVDFIKIDVEGYELPVLRGAERTIGRDRPVIILEENERGLLEHQVPQGAVRGYLESLGASLLTSRESDYVFGWPLSRSRVIRDRVKRALFSRFRDRQVP